jgi:hypothetical protein
MASGGEERTIKAGAAPGERVCIISSRLLEFNLITSFFCYTYPSIHTSIHKPQRNPSPPDSLT